MKCILIDKWCVIGSAMIYLDIRVSGLIIEKYRRIKIMTLYDRLL